MFTVQIALDKYSRIANGGGSILFDREVWRSNTNKTIIFNYGFTQLTNLYGMKHGLRAFHHMRYSLMNGEIHKEDHAWERVPVEITANDIVLCTMYVINFDDNHKRLHAFLADNSNNDLHSLDKLPVHPMLQREFPEPLAVHVELHK